MKNALLTEFKTAAEPKMINIHSTELFVMTLNNKCTLRTKPNFTTSYSNQNSEIMALNNMSSSIKYLL